MELEEVSAESSVSHAARDATPPFSLLAGDVLHAGFQRGVGLLFPQVELVVFGGREGLRRRELREPHGSGLRVRRLSEVSEPGAVFHWSNISRHRPLTMDPPMFNRKSKAVSNRSAEGAMS